MDNNNSPDKSVFWNNFLTAVEERVNSQSYNTWFKPLSLHSITDDSVTISVPQPYFSSWLEEHYLTLINSVLSTLLKRNILIRFIVNDTDGQNFSEEKKPSPQVEIKHEKNPSPTPTINGSFYNQLTIHPRFTFDSFVVGSSNQFAHAAAKAVADAPGTTAFNPLV
ncbi:DnaA N-terminal domain-containing protein, partial [Candidatus Latescibacterota bacterium]